MKKIWYEAYVKIDEEKRLHIFGSNYKRKFKTMEECEQAIKKQMRAYSRKNETMRRDGKEYVVSFADTHNLTYSIAKFEAEVDEIVYEESKADAKLKAIRDGKDTELETSI